MAPRRRASGSLATRGGPMPTPSARRRRRALHLLVALSISIAVLAPAAPHAGALSIIAQSPTGDGPGSVAVDHVSGRVFVANRGSNNVTVLDGRASPPAPVTGSPVPAGIAPSAAAVDPATGRAVVANETSHDRTVL